MQTNKNFSEFTENVKVFNCFNYTEDDLYESFIYLSEFLLNKNIEISIKNKYFDAEFIKLIKLFENLKNFKD